MPRGTRRASTAWSITSPSPTDLYRHALTGTAPQRHAVLKSPSGRTNCDWREHPYPPGHCPAGAGSHPSRHGLLGRRRGFCGRYAFHARCGPGPTFPAATRTRLTARFTSFWHCPPPRGCWSAMTIHRPHATCQKKYRGRAAHHKYPCEGWHRRGKFCGDATGAGRQTEHADAHCLQSRSTIMPDICHQMKPTASAALNCGQCAGHLDV